MSTDLKTRRKHTLIQLAVLSVFCLLLAMVGRFIRGRNFELSTFYYRDENPKGMHVVWEDAEMPVEKLEFEDERIYMTFRPEKPGDYTLSLYNEDEEFLYFDRIHVTPLGTAYSEMTGNFTGDTAVVVAITLFFAGLSIICIRNFIRLKGPSFYSYDSILTIGVGIFASVTTIMLLNVSIRRIWDPWNYSMLSVYSSVAGAGQTFVVSTLPVVVIFAILLIISNTALLRHERFRVQNVLGLGIGFLLILSEVFLFFFLNRNFSGSTQELRIHETINSVLGTAFSYFECILAGAVICGIRAAKHVPSYDQDYILILGCGFRKDGSLPPLLRGRVDKAVDFWEKQKAETGKEAVLIPSGGQGGDEIMAEAEAMYRYMRTERNVPESAIMREDQSKNTYQNMDFSKKLIRKREGIDKKTNTIFVTTNYHVFRSGVWAGLAGLSAEGLGSRTKWWFWPNAFMRECVGLMVNRIRQEILWLILLSALFGGLSYLVPW